MRLLKCRILLQEHPAVLPNLVHGGLRYLKQFEVKMVAEVGKEREIVYENGPHVTTPEWMLLPLHKGGTFGKFSTSIGLKYMTILQESREVKDA